MSIVSTILYQEGHAQTNPSSRSNLTHFRPVFWRGYPRQSTLLWKCVNSLRWQRLAWTLSLEMYPDATKQKSTADADAAALFFTFSDYLESRKNKCFNQQKMKMESFTEWLLQASLMEIFWVEENIYVLLWNTRNKTNPYLCYMHGRWVCWEGRTVVIPNLFKCIV